MRNIKMNKIVLLLLCLCVLCMVGCENNQEEIIKQLDEENGVATTITESQIDTVNEVLEKYYPSESHPLGYNTADYVVKRIDNTYRIQGVFSDGDRYIMILTENENNEADTLNSFYVNSKKVCGFTLKNSDP